MIISVKFRSIFYRFLLFIIILFSLAFNQIFGRGLQTITFFDYTFSFDQIQLVHCLLSLILVGIGINFFFLGNFIFHRMGFTLEDQIYLFLGVILVDSPMFGLTKQVILAEDLFFIIINVQFSIVITTGRFVSIILPYQLYFSSNSFILRLKRIPCQLVLLRV